MPEAKPVKARLEELWRFRWPFDQFLPDDLDHAHIPPRVGPLWLSQAGEPTPTQKQAPRSDYRPRFFRHSL